MKINKWQTIFSISLCLTPMLLGFYLWSDLPSEIPSHFNFNGEIDGYASKQFMVIHMPILLAFLNLFLLNRMKKDIKYIPPISIWLVPFLANILIPISYFISMGTELSLTTILFTVISMLYIIIGNYLPKCRHNYYFGFRIPTTLKSEENWNYTHRIAGPIFMICGFFMTICSLFKVYQYYGIFVIISLITPIILSVKYAKKQNA